MNEIAFAMAIFSVTEEGTFVSPLDIKGKVKDLSEKLKITPIEAAEFMKAGYNALFNAAIGKMEEVIASGEISFIAEEESRYEDDKRHRRYHGGH